MCVIHGHYPKGLFLLQNLPSLQRFVLCFVSSSWCSHVKVWKVNVHIGSTRSWSHVVALARSLPGCTGGFLCVCVPSSPDILLSELGRKTTQWDFVIGMASPSLSAGRTAPVWERSYKQLLHLSDGAAAQRSAWALGFPVSWPSGKGSRCWTIHPAGAVLSRLTDTTELAESELPFLGF